MKIVINATILDKRPTGLGIYTLNIIKSLSTLLKENDKIIVYTSYPESLNGLNVNVRQVHELVQPRYGIKAGILRFMWGLFVFPLRLLREEYDVLYNTTHHGILFKGKSTAQIVTIQNDVEVSFKFREQHLLQYYYFRHIVPYLLKKSSAVITTSGYARDVLLRYYNSHIARCYYTYNSYDRSVFKSSPSPRDSEVLDKYGLQGKSYIINVSASYPHKNIENLLKAFKQLKKRLGNIYLCIAGYRKAYLDSLLHNELNHYIIAIPYVSPEEMGSLYRRALCLAFPSFHESFGIPCIEAMACACPVVASNVSSLPEICGDAAFYIDPFSVESLDNGMYQVLTNDKLKKSMINKGNERAQLFSWDNTAKDIYRIIEESLDNRET